MNIDSISDEPLLPELMAMHGFDNELIQLIKGASSFVSNAQLAEYITVVAKFNQRLTHIAKSEPGQFTSSGETEIVHYYNLRRDLELFPSYFEAMAQAGIANEPAHAMLVKLQKTNKYDFSNTSKGISALIKAAKLCNEKQIDLNEGYSELFGLLDLTQEDGEQERALGIFTLGLVAGFSINQSVKTIRNIYQHAWSSGYGMMGLYDELNALKTNNLDPNMLFEALQIITKSRDSYQYFIQALYVATSRSGSAGATAVLQHIMNAGDHLAKLNGGDRNLPKVLRNESGHSPTEVAVSNLLSKDSDQQIEKIDLSPTEYFPEIKSSRLLHGILPYRLKRSLQLGLEDLRSQSKEEYSEGIFVFDPQGETWYSMGGQTQRTEESRVRHEFFTYDVSRLSNAPIIVHVHPEVSEIFLAPSVRALSHACMQTRLTKFFAAAPSGTDFMALASLADDAQSPFPLRGMIVTSSGLTCFSAPDDLKQVRKFAEGFQNLKDRVLLDFDVDSYLEQGGMAQSDEAFARKMIDLVNQQLPEGFNIITKSYEDSFAPTPSKPLQIKKQNRLATSHNPTN